MAKMAGAAFAAIVLSMFFPSAQGGPINWVQNPGFSLYTAGTGGNVDGGTITDWVLSPNAGPLGYDLLASNDANVGSTYLALEGGPFPADGTNTNFVALDGSCCNPISGSLNPTLGLLTQMLTLTGGQTYVLSFDYAAAQLHSGSVSPPTLATCEQWIVSIGGMVSATPTNLTEPTNSSCPASTLDGGSTTKAYMVTGYLNKWTTPLLSIPGYNPPSGPTNFSGWSTQTETFTVLGSGPTNELLSFFSEGSPIGGPPLNLLTNVSVVAIPEPATYALIGAGLLGIFAFRRRLKKRG